MKHLTDYIMEAVGRLHPGNSGIIVFDIDDTLLRSDPSVIKIYKKTPNGEIGLTSAEFAADPDVKNRPELFDYREFRDPIKLRQSIIQGTPLIKNLRILDAYVNAGYDFCFLTARAGEEVIKDALQDFLKIKDQTGKLRQLGNEFKKELSAAINDETKEYKGETIAEKKSNVLKDICAKYDKVVFVDDDKRNVKNARALGIPNLTVINAW